MILSTLTGRWATVPKTLVFHSKRVSFPPERILRTHNSYSRLRIHPGGQDKQTSRQLGHPGPHSPSSVHIEHCCPCRRQSLAHLQGESCAAYRRVLAPGTWLGRRVDILLGSCSPRQLLPQAHYPLLSVLDTSNL